MCPYLHLIKVKIYLRILGMQTPLINFNTCKMRKADNLMSYVRGSVGSVSRNAEEKCTHVGVSPSFVFIRFNNTIVRIKR